MHLTSRLIVTLCCTGCAFGLAGAAVTALLPVPKQTVLLDRSYCPPERWQEIAGDYKRLYSQHQRKVVTISEVVTFSSLGSQPLAELPAPVDIEQMQTFGLPAEGQRQTLLEQYGQTATVLLTCH
ncbi:MAG: hypothetical protein AB4050_15730 [Synechococcus sp.]